MINLKLRLQNKATLTSLLAAIFLMLQQFGFPVPENFQAGVNTFLIILVLLGIINDPTTAGLSDSERALSYPHPKR
ncbi:phage holin [Streptococcus acidominimus]|uniref:Holin n=1 Tax=Streptococcus acidominimus TaxID=1326 RepID=A0A1Q8EFX8_STRAI|nr:phage holin [Streptococcus acidominimus]MBF0846824.1 phage holin [Streptococcus danieliae]QBX13690.1 holin [Streptococcus phage Javan1]MBF0819139.1 phage holin [Streptococcus acidominimus]MBF0838683.1 phage holin [Streptococcus acidominimus]OLF50668.1 phage holin [Streptococcus acidominimus]